MYPDKAELQNKDSRRPYEKNTGKLLFSSMSISMVVSLTGCKIIENNVADVKKDIEQLQDSTAITRTENSEKINLRKI